MAYTPEILTSSIIAVGAFNPAIFSPDWLERNELIGSEDADVARQGASLIVSQQVTAYETKWFALQVVENQFSLTSKDALSPAFKDLAVSIFQLVPHTPVTAIGLNFLAHFKMANEADYHKVGDQLAPKDIWTNLYPEDVAGLADLTIRIQHGGRGGKQLQSKDEKRIAIQPSTRIKYGVYFSYNDHHDVSVVEDGGPRSAEKVATIIDSEWEAAMNDALRVFDSVLVKTLGK